MARPRLTLTNLGLLALTCLATSVAAEDWPQWRGPRRDGAATEPPKLVSSLPPEGLRPIWISKEPLLGGWGSPIVVGQRVYLSTYHRVPKKNVQLPPPKFPELTAEEQSSRSADELKQYNEQRSREVNERTRLSTDFEDRIHCIDAESGRELWVKSWPGRLVQWGQSSTPVADRDRLYVVGSDREVRALSQADGEILWATSRNRPDEISEPISSSVAVAGRLGVVLADQLTGLDLETGRVTWEKPVDQFGGFHSSPVIWKNGEHALAIVNVCGGSTVAVDVATGEEAWRLPSGAERSTPAVVGNRLITSAASRKGGVRCYELENPPRELWSYHRVADPGSSPAVSTDFVIVAGDKTLACLDLQTGKPRWLERLDLAQSQYSSPIAIGSMGVFADQGLWLADCTANNNPLLVEARFGEGGFMATPQFHRDRLRIDALAKADAAAAEQLWQREITQRGAVECASPAFANGRLFIRLKSGLACYEQSAPSPEAPRPQLSDVTRSAVVQP